MNLRELPEYQSRFLTANVLQGKSVRVKIERVTVEKMYDRQRRDWKQQGVLWFEGKEKGLVINKTRLAALETVFGTDNSDVYHGKQVMLSPGKQAGKDTIIVSGVSDTNGADNAASSAA